MNFKIIDLILNNINWEYYVLLWQKKWNNTDFPYKMISSRWEDIYFTNEFWEHTNIINSIKEYNNVIDTISNNNINNLLLLTEFIYHSDFFELEIYKEYKEYIDKLNNDYQNENILEKYLELSPFILYDNQLEFIRGYSFKNGNLLWITLSNNTYIEKDLIRDKCSKIKINDKNNYIYILFSLLSISIY